MGVVWCILDQHRLAVQLHGHSVSSSLCLTGAGQKACCQELEAVRGGVLPRSPGQLTITHVKRVWQF
jgi:hypothetical protein